MTDTNSKTVKSSIVTANYCDEQVQRQSKPVSANIIYSTTLVIIVSPILTLHITGTSIVMTDTNSKTVNPNPFRPVHSSPILINTQTCQSQLVPINLCTYQS